MTLRGLKAGWMAAVGMAALVAGCGENRQPEEVLPEQELRSEQEQEQQIYFYYSPQVAHNLRIGFASVPDEQTDEREDIRFTNYASHPLPEDHLRDDEAFVWSGPVSDVKDFKSVATRILPYEVRRALFPELNLPELYNECFPYRAYDPINKQETKQQFCQTKIRDPELSI